MHWKTKRLIGTIIWASLPYFAWAFGAMSFFVPVANIENRLLLEILTIGMAAFVFTYPGWKWSDD